MLRDMSSKNMMSLNNLWDGINQESQTIIMAKGMNRLQIQDRRSSEMNLNPPGICSPITMAINFGQQPVQMEHFLRKEQQQSQLFQLTNLQLQRRKARQAVNKFEL